MKLAHDEGAVENRVLGAITEPEPPPRPHLSPSSLYPFVGKHGCPVEFYHRKVLGRRRPSNLRMALGLAIDDALTMNLKRKAASGEDLPIADVVTAFVEGFRQRCSRHGFVTGGESPDYALSEGVALVRLYMDQEMPRLMPQSPDDVQREFRISPPFDAPYDLLGRIDYAGHVVEGDRIVGRELIDWKVKAAPMGSDELDNEIQPTAYNIAFSRLFGKTPRGIFYHQLIRPGTRRVGGREWRWPQTAYTKANKPAAKQPPGPSVQVEPIERTPADEAWFWNLFRAACDAIEAGVFVPVPPTHWKCRAGRCDFYSMCRGSIHRGGTLEDPPPANTAAEDGVAFLLQASEGDATP